ncbi:MAG: Crp/Fnr family transcriptional regulator [Gammaproteobacteria bacterium]
MLENIALFAFLSPEAREKLASGTHTLSFSRGSLLVSQGEISDSLYMVLSGKLKVFNSNEDGREVLLNYLGPGDAFGELALLDGEPRSASVMSMENSRVALLSRQFFLQCLRQNPDIAFELLQLLSKRIRNLTDRVSDLALLDVYGRIANTLTSLAETQEDGRLMTGMVTHQELSSMVGASREMVTRILNDLKRGGYIATENHRIVIQNRLPARW